MVVWEQMWVASPSSREFPAMVRPGAYSGDAASTVRHSFSCGGRTKRNWPSLATKTGSQLRVPGVPGAGLTLGQDFGRRWIKDILGDWLLGFSAHICPPCSC